MIDIVGIAEGFISNFMKIMGKPLVLRYNGSERPIFVIA